MQHVFIFVVASSNNKHAVISVGQEFRNGFTGWFWFRVSHEVAVKPLTRAAVI